VKKICLHYVQKCSGQYENNKAAARYVHQMANEIISQLAGVAEDIKYQQEMARIVRERQFEWDQNFPESLKSIGSPNAIVKLLNEQAEENDKLRAALESAEKIRERDTVNILRSMNVQLHASRTGAIGERHQLNVEIKNMQEEHALELQNAEKKRLLDLRELENFYTNEITKLMHTKNVSTYVLLSCTIQCCGHYNRLDIDMIYISAADVI
jgi:hypothetical protein